MRLLNHLIIRNKQLNSSEYNEKIQEIVNNYNEIKTKLYENYIQKYAELFFSSNELENINIIKLIKNGRFSRCEYMGNRWYQSKNKDWTKVIKTKSFRHSKLHFFYFFRSYFVVNNLLIRNKIFFKNTIGK